MTTTPVLTTRQQEVAQLVADGLTTKRIAASLGISVWTVHWHIGQIAKTLDEDQTKDRRTVIARWWWTHAA